MFNWYIPDNLKKWGRWLKRIGIGLAAFLIIMAAIGIRASLATQVTWRNCTPIVFGYVLWSDNHTKYKMFPDSHHIKAGTHIREMEPGLYGVTGLNPRTGNIVGYFEIQVHDEPMTMDFCQ
jgi:hypothetical protein